VNRFEIDFKRILGEKRNRISDDEPPIQRAIDKEQSSKPMREGSIPRRLKDAVNPDGSFKSIA